MSITKIYRRDSQPFAQIPNQAIRDPQISPNAFRLLAYIMSHQDGYEVTYDQIERQTTLGRYAINGAITDLTRLGWLQVDRPKLPNGQFAAKTWTVLDPTSATVGHSTMESPHLEPPTDNKNTTSIEEHLEEEILAQTEPERVRSITGKRLLQADFAEFWQAYPRKVGKGAAWKAYAKAVAAASAVVVNEGARRLAADPYLPPTQFVPYPATWLNREGWEDAPYPERELTPEEKQAKAKAENERRRLVDMEHSRKLKEESERARQSAEANPAPRCEHDRIIYACKVCYKTALEAKA